jgi:hypothetical protein
MTLQAVPDLAPRARSTPAAAAATAVRRSFTGSPGRLRVVGGLGILAVLLLTAVGTLAMQARANALTVARQDAEQLVRVQSLRTALVQADADATNAYLTGGLEPASGRAQYESYRSRAAKLVAEASRANPADAATLADVNDVLVGYTELVGTARANNRQNLPVGNTYLSIASKQLRDQGLTALARVVQANDERVAAAYTASRNAAYQFWAVVLIGLGVLVWAQLWLARRSHRYLNLPLAGSTVLLLVVAAVGGLGMAQAQSRANDTRADAYRRTTAIAQARVDAFDAKSQESLTLINRGSGATTDPADASITAAKGGLAKSRLTDDFGFTAWDAVHAQIRKLDKDDGNWDGAVDKAIGAGAQDSNALFQKFDQASAGALTQAAGQVSSDLRSGSSAVLLRSWLLLVVGLLAAAGVWWGISERLGEYR